MRHHTPLAKLQAANQNPIKKLANTTAPRAAALHTQAPLKPNQLQSHHSASDGTPLRDAGQATRHCTTLASQTSLAKRRAALARLGCTCLASGTPFSRARQ